MIKKNIFKGYSKKAIFARTVYKLLMTGEWITYADIIARANIKYARVIPGSVSNSDYYGELKKVVPEIIRAIKEREGEKSVETDGNNRNRQYRYVGENKDPLEDIKSAEVINDLNQYWQFCQDSAGFFPPSWLEHFFNGYQDLFQMRVKKRKGEQVIIADQDRQLKNIELLPSLYENIINHQVLAIKYKPYDDEAFELDFHPHFLKEYNGRWFLFGHADGHEPEFGFNLPLDRIVDAPSVIKDKKIVPPPPGFYSNYFKGIIGVSRKKGCQEYDIILRAHTHYIYKLMETKKLHRTQTIIKEFGKYEDGEYGEFIVHLEVNKEFIGTILHYGAGLEVVGPKEVRKEFCNIVTKLYHFYEDEINK